MGPKGISSQGGCTTARLAIRSANNANCRHLARTYPAAHVT
jgi:hypothetical protein